MENRVYKKGEKNLIKFEKRINIIQNNPHDIVEV
jgi:hypothetical protein